MRMMVTLLGGLLVLSACGSAGPVSQMLPEVEVLPASEASAPTDQADEVPDTPARPEESELPETPLVPAAPVQLAAETAKEPAVQTRTAECRSVSGGGDHVAQLVDVRVGSHAGFDRVVLELAPSSEGPEYFGMPSYEVVALTPPITEDGSGEPVAVAGSYFVGVVLHGGSGVEFVDADPGYVLTYQGPRELKPAFPVLVETQQTGDFERTLSWAFGLAEPSCWEVREMVDPLRLVIDFPHP